MADFDLVVRGRLILSGGVLEDGYVAVSEGRIAKVGTGEPPAGHESMDVRGMWVMPGVVDGQVHSGSQANQEGLGVASRAAAAGGITTMVDMPYDEPEPVFDAAQLRKKIAAVRGCHVDVALYGSIRPENGLEAIPGLVAGGVCGFKFSTFDAHPSRFPRIPDDVLAKAFSLIRPSGLACGVHNQDQEMTKKNIAQLIADGKTEWPAFGQAHDELVENLATARIFEIGAATGARAHIVHCSLPRGFELKRMYRAAGYPVTIETCVQYLMLNEEDHVSRLGAKAKHYPPIRPKAVVERLWTYIASGECDFVSSDHVAWGLERKADPNIFKNSSGGPGLETLLPAFWTGCERHGLEPTVVVQQLSRNPARHFLLHNRKGSIEEGADADLVVLEPGRFVFDPSKSQSAVTWSSFEGFEFSVRVAATIIRGHLAWDGARIPNSAGVGEFLRPQLTLASELA